VVVLLLTNLGLSVALTVAVLALRRSVIDYQLDHRHVPENLRASLRDVYETTIWSRVLGNLVASVIYTFLVRALLQGRRWAYRRVLWISIAGIVGLGLLFLTPYPAWVRVEQVLQMAVLAALLYFVTRPDVRAYCQRPGRRFARH
jgi:CBS domain containing-hemolysin-like protein